MTTICPMLKELQVLAGSVSRGEEQRASVRGLIRVPLELLAELEKGACVSTSCFWMCLMPGQSGMEAAREIREI